MIKSILVSLLFFAQIPFPGPGRAPVGGAPPPSISVVQSAFAQNAGNDTTVDLTLTGVTAGSTIATIVSFCKNIGCVDNGSVYTVSVDDGNAYTNGLDCYDNVNTPILVHYYPNAASGSHTITATATGSADTYYAVIVAYEISGASTTTPFDSASSVAACADGTSGTATVSNGAAITSANSSLVALTFPVTGTPSVSTGSGWSAVAGSAGAAGAYRDVSSATTYTQTWTVNGGSSVGWKAAIAAFKP